ncbi:hypothetical protein [Methylocystis sp.]|uniref:hypothetical protein n=1 Tax=Methylocystis sp. TaxID=1911079 RepID=UPI003DA5AC1F
MTKAPNRYVAVKRQTNTPKLVVLSAETSEANNSVTIGAGPNRAPWRCLVRRGVVAEVMSLTGSCEVAC